MWYHLIKLRNVGKRASSSEEWKVSRNIKRSFWTCKSFDLWVTQIINDLLAVQYFLLGIDRISWVDCGFSAHLGNIQPYFFKYLFCSIISLLLCWDSHSNMWDFLILFDKPLKPCYFFSIKKICVWVWKFIFTCLQFHGYFSSENPYFNFRYFSFQLLDSHLVQF